MEDKKEQYIPDHGPFYHGTKADLKIGSLLTAGFESNYYPEIMMNHIYFTALQNGAGLAAALAKGKGRERKRNEGKGRERKGKEGKGSERK